MPTWKSSDQIYTAAYTRFDVFNKTHGVSTSGAVGYRAKRDQQLGKLLALATHAQSAAGV